jgi:hypothetical protein
MADDNLFLNVHASPYATAEEIKQFEELRTLVENGGAIPADLHHTLDTLREQKNAQIDGMGFGAAGRAVNAVLEALGIRHPHTIATDAQFVATLRTPDEITQLDAAQTQVTLQQTAQQQFREFYTLVKDGGPIPADLQQPLEALRQQNNAVLATMGVSGMMGDMVSAGLQRLGYTSGPLIVDCDQQEIAKFRTPQMEAWLGSIEASITPLQTPAAPQMLAVKSR